MFTSTGFEMIRHLDEGRRQASLRRFWWRYAPPEPALRPVIPESEAEIIELVFGPHCEAEEPMGA
jgi:hypothetical protein